MFTASNNYKRKSRRRLGKLSYIHNLYKNIQVGGIEVTSPKYATQVLTVLNAENYGNDHYAYILMITYICDYNLNF